MKRVEIVISRIIEELCGICGLTLLLIALAQIILRVFFSMPIIWVPEVSSVLLQYMVFFGGIIVMLSGRAAVVSLFVDKIPFKAIRLGVDMIGAALSAIMGIGVLYGGSAYLAMQRNFTFSNITLKAEFILVPCLMFGAALIWYGAKHFYFAARGKENKEGEANPI